MVEKRLFVLIPDDQEAEENETQGHRPHGAGNQRSG